MDQKLYDFSKHFELLINRYCVMLCKYKIFKAGLGSRMQDLLTAYSPFQSRESFIQSRKEKDLWIIESNHVEIQVIASAAWLPIHTSVSLS